MLVQMQLGARRGVLHVVALRRRHSLVVKIEIRVVVAVLGALVR
jgi:hypothetical protein